ncbi:Nucleoside triphosphate pyrophosphohydrolase MazG [hydrothermal vent metagenome]|uniref:Nucleoside triphosphate pyrophosphohydrolase MazG n=1 Tax=hydrothermal vent metagenome TaxID=652676 RepID=A0A3B0Z0Y1_9ZZZZ
MSTLDKLLDIMALLRDPDKGCPWDVKQTFNSLSSYTVEEAYEVRDAIQRQDDIDLQAELGDLLFQVIFYAQIAKEQNKFDFDDIMTTLSDKLVRRHPHVFSENNDLDEQAVQVQWEKIKQAERTQKNRHTSLLDDIPSILPALIRAQKIQNRVSKSGFDWPSIDGVIAKVEEELLEVKEAIADNNETAIKEELGDLLFSCVNLIRFSGNNAEQQMAEANVKFERRFTALETLLKQQDKVLEEASTDELECLWNQVKEAEQ